MSLRTIAGRLFDCAPRFARGENGGDDLALFASGSTIHCSSVNTGELLGTFCGHAGLVTFIYVHVLSNGDVEVVSSSIDGTMIAWNLATFLEKGRIQCKFPLYEIHLSLNEAGGSIMDEPVNMYLVIGHDYTKRNKHTYNDREDNFRVVHTSASFHQGEISKHVEVSKLRYARQTSAIWKSSQVQETFGDYMLVASGASILVWNVRERVSLGYLSTHVSSSPITCMTVCGERDMLITGNMKGEIVLWHSVSAAMNSIRKGDCAGLDTKKDSKLPQNASKFEVPTTKLHWHAHAVASLQMAPDNEHLYSAGEEGVLVLWQISTGTRTFIPRLGGAIAHISASPLDMRALVAVTSNVLRLIDTTSMKEAWALQGTYLPPAAARQQAHEKSRRRKGRGGAQSLGQSDLVALASTVLPPPIQSDERFNITFAVERRTGFVACNGLPGCIQTMGSAAACRASGASDSAQEVPEQSSIFDDARTSGAEASTKHTLMQKRAHEILQFTRVSNKEGDSSTYVPSISFYEFFDSRQTTSAHPKEDCNFYLASLDVRRGEGHIEGIDSSLKFWFWDAKKELYRLATQIDHPHGVARVTSMATAQMEAIVGYSQSQAGAGPFAFCATAADDGSVKIWSLRRATFRNMTTANRANMKTRTPSGKQVLASATTSFQWECSCSFQYRDSAVSCVRFSRDGSLLAVAYGNVLTLWNPHSVTLMARYVLPSSTPADITFMRFIEPRTTAEDANGSGEALLVLGSANCISVFDLLTLESRWSYESAFGLSSFAAANAYDETVAVHTDSVDRNAGKPQHTKSATVWIAACAARSIGTDGETAEQSPATSASKDPAAGHEILLFSLDSNTPMREPIHSHSKPLCMLFWKDPVSQSSLELFEHSEARANAEGCLLVATEDGEVRAVDACGGKGRVGLGLGVGFAAGVPPASPSVSVSASGSYPRLTILNGEAATGAPKNGDRAHVTASFEYAMPSAMLDSKTGSYADVSTEHLENVRSMYETHLGRALKPKNKSTSFQTTSAMDSAIEVSDSPNGLQMSSRKRRKGNTEPLGPQNEERLNPYSAESALVESTGRKDGKLSSVSDNSSVLNMHGGSAREFADLRQSIFDAALDSFFVSNTSTANRSKGSRKTSRK